MADRQDPPRAALSRDTMPAARADLAETTKHIVMWDVRGADEAERARSIALVKTLFEDLAGTIPGLLQIEIGVDCSRIDYACDIVLVSEFADEASLAAYATHPAHLAVRDRLTGIRTQRHQVDYRSARWPPGRATKTSQQ